MKNNSIKKYVAECIGTFILVFIGCGTAMITGAELVATALAFGLAIVVIAYSIGNISGCHINPAVSLGVLLSGGEFTDSPLLTMRLFRGTYSPMKNTRSYRMRNSRKMSI